MDGPSLEPQRHDGTARSGRRKAAEALERLAPILAWLLAALYVGAGLLLAFGGLPLLPDSAHYAVVARNLVAGEGYVVDFVPYHLGLRDSIGQVPEDHALLRPIFIAGLFGIFGPRELLLSVPGLVYAALTGVVAFHFARRLFGTGTGLVACVLSLANGATFISGVLGTDDVGYAFYFLLALSFLERALAEGSGRHFFYAGLSGGLGLLEKLGGVVLAPLFVLALLMLRRESWRIRLRWALLWSAPYAACAGLYALRNLLSSGGLGFRANSLEWIWKAHGFESLFALHPEELRIADVLVALGPEKVVDLMVRQLTLFAAAVVQVTPWYLGSGISGPALLFLVGSLSLLSHLRRHPRFATLALLGWLGSVVLVCCLYHFEPRYLAMLLPVLAVSLAGALLGSSRGGGIDPWRAGRAKARLRLVAALLLCAFCLAAFLHTARMLRGAASSGIADVCSDAYAWIGSQTGRGEVVLTMYPWFVTWLTERPSVVIPAGGLVPLRNVARHYDARWLIVEPALHRHETAAFLRAFARRAGPRSGMERVFRGRRCEVYRLALEAGARGRHR